MSNTSEYDVVVAGAGPAGSTVSYLLRRAGLNVLIVDKAAFPREKLCGGALTIKTMKLLERVFGESVASLKEQNIIDYETGRYKIYSRNRQLLENDISLPFRFVDRYIYDDFLLAKARDAGVIVIEGDEIKLFDPVNGIITASSGRTIQGDIIIGADGANSIIRRSFPNGHFDKQHWYDNGATALELFIARSGAHQKIDDILLFFGFIDHGYAWVFPNKDRIICGLCGQNKPNKNKFRDAFVDFLNTAGIVESDNVRFKGHALPYGNFLREPYFRNTLLVGDAAGFADPLLGEGIFYAHRSAELASSAILNAIKKDNFPDTAGEYYVKSLHSNMYPELFYAGKIRRFVFRYLRWVRFYPLKIVMSILGDKTAEMIHGVRSYRWMKRINNTEGP